MAERIEQIKERVTRQGESVTHEMEDSEGKKVAVQFSMDQLESMFLRLGKELRKPDDVTLKRMEEEEKKRQTSMKQMIDLANIETQAKINGQMNCSHRKEDGRTRIMGQIHSDGMYHGICLWCNKEFKPVAPPRELLAQGVG